MCPICHCSIRQEVSHQAVLLQLDGRLLAGCCSDRSGTSRPMASVSAVRTLLCPCPADIGFCILADSLHFGRENWISCNSLHGLFSKTITSFDTLFRNDVLTRISLLQ